MRGIDQNLVEARGSGQETQENDPHKPRSTPLGLVVADPSAPAFQVIDADDPLYLLAAFAYHHADELDREHRRGLMLALESAWPQKQGRRPDRTSAVTDRYALELNREGMSWEEIAEVYGVTADTARRRAARAEQRLNARLVSDEQVRVEIRPGEMKPAPPPPDPADWSFYARRQAPSDDVAHLWFAEYRRARDAELRSKSHRA